MRRVGWLLLILVVGSCEPQELARESRHDSGGGRIVEKLEVPGNYPRNQVELAALMGVPSDDLLRCATELTADGGSHRWIYRFDASGRFSSAILFRWSDHDQHPLHPNPRPRVEGEPVVLHVFRETIVDGMLQRAELTPDEIAQEFGALESYLMDSLGEERYRFYYEGGEPDGPDPDREPGENEDGWFSTESRLSEDELRDIVDWINHKTASDITGLIRDYRMTVE